MEGSSSVDFAAPLELSKLQVRGPLGRGGFASCWRATYAGRDIALKVLQPHPTSAPAAAPGATCTEQDRFARMFLNEAEVMSQLQHRYIVKCFGVAQLPAGSVPNQPKPALAMALELCEGGTVKDLITRGMASGRRAYKDKQAYAWLHQTASALAHLHARKPALVHRDIKPENVFLRKGSGGDLEARLADLGLHVELAAERPAMLRCKSGVSARSLAAPSVPAGGDASVVSAAAGPGSGQRVRQAEGSLLGMTTQPDGVGDATGLAPGQRSPFFTVSLGHSAAPSRGLSFVQKPLAKSPHPAGSTHAASARRLIAMSGEARSAEYGRLDGQWSTASGMRPLADPERLATELQRRLSALQPRQPSSIGTTDPDPSAGSVFGSGAGTGHLLSFGSAAAAERPGPAAYPPASGRRGPAAAARSPPGSGQEAVGSAPAHQLPAHEPRSLNLRSLPDIGRLPARGDEAPTPALLPGAVGGVQAAALAAASALSAGQDIQNAVAEHVGHIVDSLYPTETDPDLGPSPAVSVRAAPTSAVVSSPLPAEEAPEAAAAAVETTVGFEVAAVTAVADMGDRGTGAAAPKEGPPSSTHPFPIYTSLSGAVAACSDTGATIAPGTSSGQLGPSGPDQTFSDILAKNPKLVEPAPAADPAAGLRPVASLLRELGIAELKPLRRHEMEWVYGLTGKAGSFMYMAPEVYRKLPYNEKSDVFSFGVLAYEVLAGEHLIISVFNTCRAMQMGIRNPTGYAEMVARGYRPPRLRCLSDAAWSLISACWHEDPVQRPGMGEVAERLRGMMEGLGAPAAREGGAAGKEAGGNASPSPRREKAAGVPMGGDKQPGCLGCVIC
ncbi:hypothetical protein GPECTOR_39g446 [Gonium pectorale]|uniref:Protein kinase domain-containing protein n=1 Tax=Gonium pectorale TaxID=33097 RepID=A0A150GAT2_GONPE|nr:hypothetical protein GPECTOR_39g446 [Gonium pectorale]|eukprot:KXZ46952.1 hypothetical protein GPECTOR_39g446 [Gonium pectorale]